MSVLRYWKIVVGLMLVFVAGAVTGSIATHQVIKRGVQRALDFDRWKSGVLQVLQAKLKLTPEQNQKIAALLDSHGTEIRKSFSNAFNECGHTMVQLQHQIDHELTPAQRAVHAQMKREFRAELKKKFNFDLPEE